MADRNSGRAHPRSLPLSQWPDADRQEWENACRPGSRLKSGGAASRLAQVTRGTITWRYGLFLGFLQQDGRLNAGAAAASQVTPSNVEAYIASLTARVRSVTLHGYVQGLHRAARLLAPSADFSWLGEIEKDLKLEMQPLSKLDRLALTTRLVKAGLKLMDEAQQFGKMDFGRARQVRNGLMVSVLAFCPMRRKNFAGLEIGRSFQEVGGRWWICLPAAETKTRRRDERPLPEFLNPYIDLYLKQARPVLLRGKGTTNALWISAKTSGPIHPLHISRLISQVTLETIGVDVSPHLFRTAAASTAAVYGGDTPHLASAVLGHTDPGVAEKHYNFASSMDAAKTYAEIIESLRRN
jgi:integrase